MMLYLYEEMKEKELKQIDDQIEMTQAMTRQQVKQLCAENPIDTPNACKTAYIKQLKGIKRRLEATTDEELGRGEFRLDTLQIMLDKQQLDQAGMAKCMGIKFPRYEFGAGQFSA